MASIQDNLFSTDIRPFAVGAVQPRSSLPGWGSPAVSDSLHFLQLATCT